MDLLGLPPPGYKWSKTPRPGIVNANYSALTEKLREILKLQSLKLMIDSELLSVRIFLVNATLKIGQGKYLLYDSVQKIYPWKVQI